DERCLCAVFFRAVSGALDGRRRGTSARSQGGDRSDGRESMTESEILFLFRQTHALLEGHFILRSGLHSRQFFQCALLLKETPVAVRICDALAEKLGGIGANAVISP